MSNNTITVPASATNGHPIVICVVLQAGQAVATFGSGGTNPWTNLDSAVNTVSGSCAHKVVTTGDPTTYTPTWVGNSGGSFITMVDIGLNTDGSTPALGEHNIGAAAVPTQTALTTTTNGDEIIGIEMNTAILTSTGTTPMAYISTDSSGAGTGNYAVLGMGQEIAGLVPSVSLTVSTAAPPIAETIAFKADQPLAAMFVGVGSSSTNAGSASSVTPTIASNSGAGDTFIASILENSGTTGIAITAPPIISVTGAKATVNPAATTSVVVTVPTPTRTGQLMIAHILSVGTPTKPACNCWTQFTVTNADANTFFYYHYSTGSSEPSTYTWTIAGNNLFDGAIANIADTSGGIPTVGAALFLACASSSSCTSAAVTTTHNNAMIYNYWQQGVLSTLTLPSTQVDLAVAPTKGYSFGWFNLHTAGTTPTQTATSGSTSTWRTAQIEVYSTTAASLNGSTAWTQVSPTNQIGILPGSMAIDPTNVVQLSVYYLYALNPIAIGTSGLFKFASNAGASDSIIATMGNLDPVSPVDSSSVLASANNNSSQAPSITPTTGDMLLFYSTTPGVISGFGSTILDANSANRIGLSYASLANIGTQTNTVSANTSPFVTYTLGLQEKAH